MKPKTAEKPKAVPAPAEPPKTETPTAALARTETPAPFMPENLSQAARLATNLSLSSMLPKALRGKPHDVLAILITGHELGLGPMQSLRGMHVIEGKAVMSAELMSGLVKRHPDCEYLQLVESTDEIATYETQRNGYPNPTQLSFTIGQAKTAGLLGKDNWKHYPAAMLRARAVTALCKAEYGDLTNGLYTFDEADEIQVTVEGQELKPEPGASKLDMLADQLKTDPEEQPASEEKTEPAAAPTEEEKDEDIPAVETTGENAAQASMVDI